MRPIHRVRSIWPRSPLGNITPTFIFLAVTFSLSHSESLPVCSQHTFQPNSGLHLPTIPVLRRNPSTNTPSASPVHPSHIKTVSSHHVHHSHAHGHHKHKRLYPNVIDSGEHTPRDGNNIEMMRSNSYNKNSSRYTGGAGGIGEDEREQLLTPGEHHSGEGGGSGSDLEIGNRRTNKKGKHNRRNSNGLLGDRRPERRNTAGKERTLCLVATSLFAIVTIILLIATRAIPSPFGGHSHQIDPTDPTDPHQNPGKGGKGGPHVVVPIGGPQLPPPTDLPRNDAYLVKAEKGAVASEDVDCSKMGTQVLKEGGNAVVSIVWKKGA